MSAGLTQVLEILQAHGLMERSDERFLSAQDLVELNEHLALIETEELTEYRRAQIRALEERIDDARAALG